MAIKMKLTPSNAPEMPTFVLTTRNGRSIGGIVPHDVNFHDEFGTYSGFSFMVNKSTCPIWDELTDFKLIYYKEANEFYEISVEIDDSDDTVKIVTATSLGYAELSQIKLYGIEINTEDDISRDDYVTTVLYNSENAAGSLLDRITEKCPHYNIAHVDSTIAGMQRTFSFDNTTIMDAFNEIAEEIDCVFEMRCGRPTVSGSSALATDGISRSIYVYDLESFCNDCGRRTTGVDTCEYCGSDNLTPGYGEDTTILITKDNLTNEIRLTTDTGSVKNCFRLSAGDEYMTATIRNCNPNGSDYLWYIDDEMREEMSDELRARLSAYDALYEQYTTNASYTIGASLLSDYNDLVTKYAPYKSDLTAMTSPIVGHANLMNAMYDVIDFGLFLTDEFMPSVVTQDTDAETELAKLTAANLSPIAVDNIKSASATTVNSTIESVIKVTVNTLYKAEILTSAYTQDASKTFGTWVGTFKVTNYSDEDDTATSGEVTLTVNGDTETFLRQRIDRALNQQNAKNTDITGLFAESLSDFQDDITLYCLESLRSIYEACRACIDILIEQGVANDASYPALYTDLYVPYYTRLQYIEAEIQLREQEIAIVNGTYDIEGNLVSDGVLTTLTKLRDNTSEVLDFEAYLGETLWLEFAAYRREDEYNNSNYISDGLSNADVFSMALEFIETAKKDLLKAATKQHSITSTLNNLLAIPEFAPLADHFAVGNWLRVRIDGVLYKLRLVSYDAGFDDRSQLSVAFSDVRAVSGSRETYKKMAQNLSSMASSYGAVMRQASRGNQSQDTLSKWHEDGLSLTAQKIVSDARYQEVVYGDDGILLRKYIPETGVYDDAQTKIINQGLYVTTDNWQTARAGIGYFTYYDPFEEETVAAYGVIAQTIVSDLVLSSNVRIFNESGSVLIDTNGFVATASSGSVSVKIQPNSTSGVFVISGPNGDLLAVDNSGNLSLSGYITASSFTQATGATVDSGGFRLYGEVPIYRSSSSSIQGCYIGYSTDLNTYIAPEEEDADPIEGFILREPTNACYVAGSSTRLYLKGGTGGIRLDGTVYIGDQTLASYIASIAG